MVIVASVPSLYYISVRLIKICGHLNSYGLCKWVKYLSLPFVVLATGDKLFVYTYYVK